MVGIESTNILGVVVCLPNSLKTNFIKQNFAWWNIWISHLSLQNRDLLKQWNSISYWNGEILFVLITLWTIVSWQNYYIKALFLMDLYAFHHSLTISLTWIFSNWYVLFVFQLQIWQGNGIWKDKYFMQGCLIQSPSSNLRIMLDPTISI